MFCRKCGEENPADSIFCQACGEKFPRQAGAEDPKAKGFDETVRRQLQGRYEIVRRLGAGGMATVYLAREEALDRQVAVKVLPPDQLEDQEAVERFVREAQITASLEHPNVVRIYALHQEPELSYYVMNLLKGGSLTERLRVEGVQPVECIVEWGSQVCAALSHAHRRGIILRDLKPDNIMLTEDDRAVVTDLGIARASQDVGLTQMGTAIGTPQYMSPEQALGHALDARTDLYSLGVVLYQLATGTLPFNADEPASLIYMQVHETPQAPDARRKEVPAWLCEVIMRCLAKAPDDRYVDADALAAALEAGAPAVAAAAAPTAQVEVSATAAEDAAAVAAEPSAAEPAVAETETETDESADQAVPPASAETPREPGRRRLVFGAVFVLVHALVGVGAVALAIWGRPWARSLLAAGDWVAGLERTMGHLPPEEGLGLLVCGLVAGLGQWAALRLGGDVTWRWIGATGGGALLGVAALAVGARLPMDLLAPPVWTALSYMGLALAVGVPLVLQCLVGRTYAGWNWLWLAAAAVGVGLVGGLVWSYRTWGQVLTDAVGTPWDGMLVAFLGGCLYALPQLFYLLRVWGGDAAAKANTGLVLGGALAAAAVVAYGLVVGVLSLGSHRQPVRDVVFSVDGRFVISASEAAKRWNGANGRKLASYEPALRGRIVAASLDAAGQRVLSGYDSGQLVVWEGLGGRALMEVAAHDSAALTAVALSADGRRALSATVSGTIKVWDGASGSEILVLAAHGEAVRFAEFGPGGQRFLTVAADTARLWDMADGSQIALLAGVGPIGAVAFAADGTRLLTGGRQGGLTLWDLTDGSQLIALQTGEAAVTVVALEPGGGRAASGDDQGTLRLWDLEKGREIAGLAPHNGAVTAVAFSPDGGLLASGGEDLKVRLWDVEGLHELRTFYDQTGLVLAGILLVLLAVFSIAFALVRLRGASEEGDAA